MESALFFREGTKKFLTFCLGTDDEIDSYFDELVAGKQTTENVSDISVQFSPDVELSNGHSRGHITVSGTVKYQKGSLTQRQSA